MKPACPMTQYIRTGQILVLQPLASFKPGQLLFVREVSASGVIFEVVNEWIEPVLDHVQIGGVQIGDVFVDFNSRTAWRKDGSDVRFTKTEWRILEVLYGNRGIALSHLRLLDLLQLDRTEYWIRAFISRIRTKLGRDAILSRPGGYLIPAEKDQGGCGTPESNEDAHP